MTPYYDHAGIVMYHGDCREILPHLPKVDLVLTDPPYGTGWVRGGGDVGMFYAKHEQPDWDVWDLGWQQFTSASAHAIFCPVDRAREIQGTPLYWRKTNPRPGGPTREAIVVWPKPWGMDKWEFAEYNGDSTFHPCQKPLALMCWLVTGLTGAGNSILDPFMGSGTTLVAAKQLGRRAIGIEIEERYCEIAVKRLSQEMLPFVAEKPQPEQLTLANEESA